MNRKMYWGVALLILLIGTAAVFVILHELAENRQLAKENADLEELVNRLNEPQVSENNPPPAEPGFKWVWHHNHWDKVPINANGPIAHHEDPTDPIDQPPVEERPHVTEVSKGIGKRFEERTDEELRNSYSHYSPAELEYDKEVNLGFYEQLEELVPLLEASVKRSSENMQKYPFNSKFWRHQYEQDSRSLKHKSAKLARLKRILEVVHNVK